MKSLISTLFNEPLELVRKDWTAWNKAHAGKARYSDLLPAHEVGGWKLQAAGHEKAINGHISSGDKHPSGSPNRKAHSDAAVAHINAATHAYGVLEGTHDPATYSGANLKAMNASTAAKDFGKSKKPFTGFSKIFRVEDLCNQLHAATRSPQYA